MQLEEDCKEDGRWIAEKLAYVRGNCTLQLVAEQKHLLRKVAEWACRNESLFQQLLGAAGAAPPREPPALDAARETTFDWSEFGEEATPQDAAAGALAAAAVSLAGGEGSPHFSSTGAPRGDLQELNKQGLSANKQGKPLEALR